MSRSNGDGQGRIIPLDTRDDPPQRAGRSQSTVRTPRTGSDRAYPDLDGDEAPERDEDAMTRKSDVGPYAIVPEWVLDADISARAVRLYAVLARYANDDNACWPSRRTLWERLRCSERSLDDAVRELEDVGAIERQRRTHADGGFGSNLYFVRFTRPQVGPSGATGGATTVERGGAGTDARMRVSTEREPLNEREPARKRAVAPPATFTPTDSHREYAHAHGLDLDHERSGWLAHCAAKGTTYRNVNAGFTTWLHHAVDFGRGRRPAARATRADATDL